MKSFLSKMRQSGTPVFWLVIVLLILTAGATSVIVPMHFVRAKNRQEPEVTVHALNKFGKTIRVVGDVDYKPFTYLLDGSEVPRGYDVELVTELANRMEVNLDLRLMNWEDATVQMNGKKADLILGCDWQDETVMDCKFTIPTFEEKFVAFELEPSKSFRDLYGKKIAVIAGCGLKETLVHYQLWSNCKEYEDVSDCAKAVLGGECDCFIAHHTIGEVCLRDIGRDGKRFRGRMDIASGQMCFGVSPDVPDLFEKVNAALLTMRADGTMGLLEHKWLERFDADISLGEYMRRHPFVLFLTINLLLAVVLVFLVMNHYLIRIRREKDRAIAAERSRNFFFSTVSHDIRTPLNAIIGFSELLKNGIEDEDERKRALNAITTSGHTLLELVNDVLDLSKLEAGKTVITPELTDLPLLASGVLHSFDASIEGRDIALVEDFPPVPFLYVDPYRIRQILFNLIGNAVKFTERGRIVLSLSFGKDREGDEGTGSLTIAVSDTGCGIAPEEMESILKPFEQAKRTDVTKGTGLGLPICCQLAERMGGKLSLESVLGQGSTFTVAIPNVRFSEAGLTAAEPAAEPVKPKTESAPGAKKRRILIVDDVPLNVKVIQSMLHRLNVSDIVAAGNGAEALDILEKGPPFDIVLTDMWMPVMDGERLIREIRGREQWKDLLVYAVTADVETRKTYKASGFNGILLKPIRLDQLRALFE